MTFVPSFLPLPPSSSISCYPRREGGTRSAPVVRRPSGLLSRPAAARERGAGGAFMFHRLSTSRRNCCSRKMDGSEWDYSPTFQLCLHNCSEGDLTFLLAVLLADIFLNDPKLQCPLSDSSLRVSHGSCFVSFPAVTGLQQQQAPSSLQFIDELTQCTALYSRPRCCSSFGNVMLIEFGR